VIPKTRKQQLGTMQEQTLWTSHVEFHKQFNLPSNPETGRAGNTISVVSAPGKQAVRLSTAGATWMTLDEVSVLIGMLIEACEEAK